MTVFFSRRFYAMLNFLLRLVLLFSEAPNGLRYPRWGGRRDAVRLEKC
jgi:hypothetical protein